MKVYVYSTDDGRYAYSLDSWGLDLPTRYSYLGLLLDRAEMTAESKALREMIERDGTQFLKEAPSVFGCEAYRVI